MIQSVRFTNAVFEVFAEAYLRFLVFASAKKLPRIKFFRNFLKYVSKNKIYFCLKKKLMFQTFRIFSNLIHNADHLLD